MILSQTRKNISLFCLFAFMGTLYTSPIQAGADKVQKKKSALHIVVNLATHCCVFYGYTKYIEPRLLSSTTDEALKTTLKEVGKLVFLKQITDPISDAGKYFYSLIEDILNAPADIIAPEETEYQPEC